MFRVFLGFVLIHVALFVSVRAFAQDAPVPAAHLTALVGTPTAVRPGVPARVLTKGSPVYPGETVVLGPKTAAKLTFQDGSTTALFENSKFSVDSFSHAGGDAPTQAAFSVIEGKVRFFVRSRQGSNDVKFKTSAAVLGVRGTSGYIAIEGSSTRLQLETGIVDFAPAASLQDAVAVTAGLESFIASARSVPSAPTPFDPAKAASPVESQLDVRAGEDHSAPAQEATPETLPDTTPEAAPVDIRLTGRLMFTPEGQVLAHVDTAGLTAHTMAPRLELPPVPPVITQVQTAVQTPTTTTPKAPARRIRLKLE